MGSIKINNINKKYGSVEVIESINLEVIDGEFLVLVGPSGCGKSTLLRMIAGLEEISGGEILIADRSVNDLPPRMRDIAMVFQNYALYPHMTVRENMGFSLKIAGQSDAEIEKKVDDVAKRLALTELLARKPSELSGGQRQRVAMGRAIVRNPAAFLFDEPLSNLDAKLRTEMRAEIKRLHQALKTTIVYVTHDQTEAMTLADRIVVLRGGHIEQLDTPDAIYHQPKNLFVAQFIGSPPMNIARGVVEADCVRLEAGLTLPLDPAARSVTIGQEVIVGLRPDDLNPTGHGVGEDNRVAFETSVALTEPMGGESIIYCDVGNGLEWLAKMYDAKPVKTGERIELSFQRDKLHLFDAVTEQRIS